MQDALGLSQSTEDSLQRIFRNDYTAALCIISLKIFFLNWWFMNVVSIAEQKYLWPQHVPSKPARIAK